MRLKEDTSSWHSSAIIKRDFRHNGDDLEPVKLLTKKKNTRKWCYGKVGREHTLIRLKPIYNWSWDKEIYSYVRVICTTCKKEMYRRGADLPLKVEVKSEDNRYYGDFIPVNGKLSNNQLNIMSWY